MSGRGRRNVRSMLLASSVASVVAGMVLIGSNAPAEAMAPTEPSRVLARLITPGGGSDMVMGPRGRYAWMSGSNGSKVFALGQRVL